MTVAAEQGQVVNVSSALTALMQGLYVMTFDEALPKIPVEFFKVEPAYLAYKRAATSQDTPNLLIAKLRAPLSNSMKAQQVPAFHDTLVLVAEKLKGILRFVCERQPPEADCDIPHTLRIIDKLV
jgi:hypothetical protein